MGAFSGINLHFCNFTDKYYNVLVTKSSLPSWRMYKLSNIEKIYRLHHKHNILRTIAIFKEKIITFLDRV